MDKYLQYLDNKTNFLYIMFDMRLQTFLFFITILFFLTCVISIYITLRRFNEHQKDEDENQNFDLVNNMYISYTLYRKFSFIPIGIINY